MPAATKPAAMLGLIERLGHIRAVGLDAGHGHRVHQMRLAWLACEAGRTTVQHIAGYERQRRHATLVVAALDLTADPRHGARLDAVRLSRLGPASC